MLYTINNISMVLKIIISKYSCILKIISRNTFPEPQPDSASYSCYVYLKGVLYTYGRKSVDRIATQSMSKTCNLWRLIVGDCDYAESYGWFLSGGNANTSHAV